MNDGSAETWPRTVWPVRGFNAIARGAATLGLRQGPITADRVLRRARRLAGLEELGPGDARTALDLLTRGFDSEAGLHPFGRLAAIQFLVEVVINRLRVVDALRRDPEILEQPIRRPLFVIGAPRTGTTLLLKLLCCDPDARPLLSWEGRFPVPPARPGRGGVDPRIRKADRAFSTLRYLAPGLDRIHEVRTENPGEDVGLLEHTLVSWVFLILADLPSYERWLEQLDDAAFVEAYRFHRRQLQLLQWQRAGEHWVLKCPGHLQTLGPLLEVYPDAAVVQTHRDPAKVLPSSCSLFATVRNIMAEQSDLTALGRTGLDGGLRAAERLLAVRERLDDGRVLDVQYADIVNDPLGTVRRIHGHFGYATSPEMERRMQSWVDSNPRHKHGVHSYTLQRFGLGAEEVRAAYRPYTERFGVPHEG